MLALVIVTARAGRERPLECIEVELEAAISLDKRDLDDGATDLAEHREERRVDGRIDDDPVARLGDDAEDFCDCDHDVGREQDRVGVDRPVVSSLREPGERRAELRRERVAEVVGVERGLEDVADRRRKRKVHLRDPHGQDVLGIEGPFGTSLLSERLEREVVEGSGHSAGLHFRPDEAAARRPFAVRSRL